MQRPASSITGGPHQFYRFGFLDIKLLEMKKHFYAGLMALALILFSVPHLHAQEESKDQLWYCWEETVRPDMVDEYLALNKELIELCKEENYPFLWYAWSRNYGSYEFWFPISSLDDIQKIEKEWPLILKAWGEEKAEAYTRTIMANYSKTATFMGDLAHFSEDPDPGIPFTYGRWIELYMRPGTMDECISLIKKLNEHRVSFGIQDYVQFGKGGLGFQSPVILAHYMHKSQQEFLDYFESTPEAYKDHFQDYLDNLFELLVRSPDIYNYTLLWELSYIPGQ